MSILTRNIQKISAALEERAEPHKMITTDLEASFLAAALRFCGQAEMKCDGCAGKGKHGTKCVAPGEVAVFIESILTDCNLLT